MSEISAMPTMYIDAVQLPYGDIIRVMSCCDNAVAGVAWHGVSTEADPRVGSFIRCLDTPMHRHGAVVHTRHGACGAYTAHQVTENADKFLAKVPPKVAIGKSINVRAVKGVKAARTVVRKLSTHAH